MYFFNKASENGKQKDFKLSFYRTKNKNANAHSQTKWISIWKGRQKNCDFLDIISLTFGA